MVPSRIALLEELPKTPNGKLDRNALAALPATTEDAKGDRVTPRTPAELSASEAAMSAIWADVLGIPAVDPDDDFFSLGGHSLLAVRLMAQVEKAFGVKVPIAALFEAPTVRQLTAIAVENPKRAWVSLVPIRKEGSKPPFFCVHGVGGEVLGYAALAAALPPDRPFVALRAAGHDGATEPLTSIEEQAALYVREMIAYYPSGPYCLGGHSHGGRVALEMALQLERMNREVAFIGIFDSTPVERRPDVPGYAFRWLRNLPKWLWYEGRTASWREHVDRVRRMSAKLRRPKRTPVNGRSTNADVRSIMRIDHLPERIQRLYELDFLASRAYRPSGLCGPVTLFRALGQPLFGSHEPDLGWHRVSRDPVEIRHLPGNHLSILREPHVAALAAELSAALDRALAPAGGQRPLTRAAASETADVGVLDRPAVHAGKAAYALRTR
jgi:thioesterase domain-containing protein/acyl carrier protein